LTIGQQAVQSTHAAINFCFEHRSRAGPWFENSNYLVQLSVNNEKELLKLIEKCEKMGLTYTVFKEPDLNDSMTAISIEPSPLTKKVVSHLPLLFKNLN
jgi:peptidyl-tRNA hydrolase